MRLLRVKTISVIQGHVIDYPTPAVGYFSSFGSLSGLSLSVQLLTGILLAAHYTPHISLAFSSIEHIMRDVNEGWLFRYYHSNGASIFFICIYLHIMNNFDAEAEDLLWLSGLGLYLAIMATAFMGYILPWGQMSFWGATVITNLFEAIPYVGKEVARWLWGGFSVDNPTINRFFSFHYLLPFIIASLIIVHLGLLHIDASQTEDNEFIEFYYYYFIKDLFAFFLVITVFSLLVFFIPNFLNHPDNYSMASVSVTPAHLVPEWYFLPFYGVLRSTPHKAGGLVLMFIMIADVFLVDLILDDITEWIEPSIVTLTSADSEVEIDGDVGTLSILFFLGGKDIDEPYTEIASIISFAQFVDYFNLLLTELDVL